MGDMRHSALTDLRWMLGIQPFFLHLNLSLPPRWLIAIWIMKFMPAFLTLAQTFCMTFIKPLQPCNPSFLFCKMEVACLDMGQHHPRPVLSSTNSYGLSHCFHLLQPLHVPRHGWMSWLAAPLSGAARLDFSVSRNCSKSSILWNPANMR